MPESKANITLERLFRIAAGLLACSFLLYTLLTYKGYDDLLSCFARSNSHQWYPFIPVVLLVPFNWYLESLKWQNLLQRVEPVSIRTAFYSVLAGLTTGIFSPSRVGEFAGRILFLRKENRKKGSVLWAVGSLTMTVVILVFGIPAAFLFFSSGREAYLFEDINALHYLSFVLITVFCLLLFYFLLPYLSRLFPGKLSRYFSSLLDTLRQLSAPALLKILGLSLMRYLVFCLQYWIMLYALGVELSPYEAYTGIFTAYLIITFLPSLFLTDAAIKSSVFLLVLSSFSADSVSIIAASMLLWILNLFIPTLYGVFLLYKKPVQVSGN